MKSERAEEIRVVRGIRCDVTPKFVAGATKTSREPKIVRQDSSVFQRFQPKLSRFRSSSRYDILLREPCGTLDPAIEKSH